MGHIEIVPSDNNQGSLKEGDPIAIRLHDGTWHWTFGLLGSFCFCFCTHIFAQLVRLALSLGFRLFSILFSWFSFNAFGSLVLGSLHVVLGFLNGQIV